MTADTYCFYCHVGTRDGAHVCPQCRARHDKRNT